VFLIACCILTITERFFFKICSISGYALAGSCESNLKHSKINFSEFVPSDDADLVDLNRSWTYNVVLDPVKNAELYHR
jgi:hypothetical protein